MWPILLRLVKNWRLSSSALCFREERHLCLDLMELVHDAIGPNSPLAFTGKLFLRRVAEGRARGIHLREDLRVRDDRIAPICYLFDGDASMSLLQMPDCWRIILRIAAEERALARCSLVITSTHQELEQQYAQAAIDFTGITPEQVERAAVRYYAPMLCPNKSDRIRAVFNLS